MTNLQPKNIHCLALNYQGVGITKIEPLYFVKSAHALCFDGARIEYPEKCLKLWTEVELALVVKNNCINISAEEAPDFISGYTVAADLTCENIANRDHHLAYSKSRKNFCPVQPDVVTLQQIDLSELRLTTAINGKITQTGDLSQMLFNPFKSLSYISQITELCQGDIVLTGTPAGVENNIIRKGDRVLHWIENIGNLEYEII
ncbi:MAG: FAA hydrolase family protein [Calditrichaeota bacterium]|nr:MAG: FAA hydrolase family protein [Calditrichota bacterium]